MSLIDSMSNQLFGWYTLTRYLLIYLLREALETEQVGKELCQNPSNSFAAKDGRKRVNEALKKTAIPIAALRESLHKT